MHVRHERDFPISHGEWEELVEDSHILKAALSGDSASLTKKKEEK